MGRRGYPAEFRRRVLELIGSGRRVGDVARDLGISDQTVYDWRHQERIDRGIEPGLTSAERAELVAARRRIRELETELAIHRARGGVAEGDHKPKSRFAAVEVMARRGLPVQLACRVLEVSESGYYARRSRAPSPRSIRHAWITDVIRQVARRIARHLRGRRVHAELTLGRGHRHRSRGRRDAHAPCWAARHFRPATFPACPRASPRRPTASSASSTATSATSSGSPISPSIPPERARSTAPSCSTPGRAEWSAGRSTRRRVRRS